MVEGQIVLMWHVIFFFFLSNPFNNQIDLTLKRASNIVKERLWKLVPICFSSTETVNIFERFFHRNQRKNKVVCSSINSDT